MRLSKLILGSLVLVSPLRSRRRKPGMIEPRPFFRHDRSHMRL